MRLLFSFKGRLNRKTLSLILLLIWVGFYPERVFVDLAIHSLNPSFTLRHVPVGLRSVTLSDNLAIVVLVAGALGVVGLLVASISCLVRRFHDFNLSGWFVLLAFCLTLPIPDFGMDELELPLGSLIWMLLMVLIPGTRGANRFGAPPMKGKVRCV